MKKLRVLSAILLILATVVSCVSCEQLFGDLLPGGAQNDTTGKFDPGFDNGDSANKPCYHEWKEATCLENAVCKKCGEQGTVKGAHKYYTELIASTCQEEGYALHTCSVCGTYYKDGYLPVSDHAESDWKFSTQDGNNAQSLKYKDCTVCGKVLESELVDSHTHSFETVEAKEPTCTESGHGSYEYCTICGYSDYLEISALGHSWGEWTSNGNSTHVSVCKNDSSHVKTEYCFGLNNGELICSTCGSGYDISMKKGNSSYGYYSLAGYEKADAMQALYKQMAKTCEEFALSNEDVVANYQGYHIIDTYILTDLSLTSEEARSVWKVFYDDHPLYYWLSNISVASPKELMLVIYEDYAEAEYRRQCDSAISAFTNECVSYVGKSSDELEKTMSIAAYIVENMEYAYDENGIPENAAWAHNIIGFASYSYGVCEAYAKTFMYLCLMNDVDCIIGTGYGKQERHAWNYVSIDGEWYGADITWTDNFGDTVVYDSFGISDDEFHVDHSLNPSDTFGIDFSCEIPDISDTSLELCVLYKNGNKVGIFKSLESAVEQMTDFGADYEISLGGFYSMSVGVPVHTLDIASLPSVKSLKFSGINYPSDPNFIDMNTILVLSEDVFTLQGNVEFENLDIRGKAVKLDKASLTLSGDTVYLDASLIGDDKDSTVTVLTEDTTYFAHEASIYKLISENHKVVFSENSLVYNLRGDEIYTGKGVNVTVKNYI